ncbi:type 1 glutamine amidotransferase domain-containing protein [Sporocytophaga myxococcoides]|uniref:type 1 glutamine amidotransferase domain-containing protein n=1 Tax=Sporocytophaga myxococcoides TaxID=153721 RepID=UPI0003FBC9B6|nr:type 1 glutamine amidotransferase domain-containing protein [Sporocytophaga myxococcoides]
MQKNLRGIKVALLVDNGFEQVELTEPVKALREANAHIEIIAPEKKIKGWNLKNWGDEITADILLDEATPENYDALILPGGVMNPDFLRMKNNAIEFVKTFLIAQKPVAAICHGPWTLIETGLIKGRKLTSYPSLKTDLTNAGATWIDEPVVTDKNLITSRRPSDLPAFNDRIINALAALVSSSNNSLNRPPVKGETMDDIKSKDKVKK